jgi:hypothetical protein
MMRSIIKMEYINDFRVAKEELLEVMSIAKIVERCNTLILLYFSQLNRICISSLASVFDVNILADKVESKSQKIRKTLPKYMKNEDIITERHFRILYKEDFAISVA